MKCIPLLLLSVMLVGCGGSGSGGAKTQKLISSEWDSVLSATKLYAVDADQAIHTFVGTIPDTPVMASQSAGVFVCQNESGMTVRRQDGTKLFGMNSSYPTSISANGQWFVLYTLDGQRVMHPDGTDSTILATTNFVAGVFNDGNRFVILDNTGGLSVTNRDGSQTVSISPFLNNVSLPAVLSPDEKWIAFRNYGGGSVRLAIADVRTGDLQAVASPSVDFAAYRYFAFSPDSRSLLYVDPGDSQAVASSLHKIDLKTLRDQKVGAFSLHELLLSTSRSY